MGLFQYNNYNILDCVVYRLSSASQKMCQRSPARYFQNYYKHKHQIQLLLEIKDTKKPSFTLYFGFMRPKPQRVQGQCHYEVAQLLRGQDPSVDVEQHRSAGLCIL